MEVHLSHSRDGRTGWAKLDTLPRFLRNCLFLLAVSILSAVLLIPLFPSASRLNETGLLFRPYRLSVWESVESALERIRKLQQERGEQGSEANTSTPLLPEVSPETKEKFRVDYASRYGGPPPLLLTEVWLPYALENRCLVQHEMYDKIRRDLTPFRDILKQRGEREGLTELRRILGNAVNAAGGGTELRVVDFQDGKVAFFGLPFSKRRTRERLCEPLAPLLPSMTTVWNIFDEPKVLPIEEQRAASVADRWNDFVFSPWKIKEEGGGEKTNTSSPFFRGSHFVEQRCRNLEEYERRKRLHGFFRWNPSPIFTDELLPVFSQTKPVEAAGCRFADMIVPSDYYVEPGLVAAQLDASEGGDWEGKKPTIFWRGSTTGAGHSWLMALSGSVEESHRVRVVNFVNDPTRNVFWNRTDVGFGGSSLGVVQADPLGSLWVHWKSFLWDRVSKDEMYKRQVLLDIDGNTFSQRIVPFWMRSGSVVLKVESLFEDWFSGLMKEGEHFVSVRLDLSDWNERVGSIWSSPEKTVEMIRRAEETSRRFMRIEDMRCFLLRVLLEFHSVFSGHW
uniref:Glycosyl transferase CAP10 domain-containing protein n=1 Tax=Chromera velia CCMP2878 TaxID=1169474 RepID=A0A0G4I339_9ALVE|eukprot:Cvel_1748.t1-p1 / transcript=Cvel_1748.t1 / gene=Cvel_1748 / organism=Chromera_velia_CCMP2878 / gene_product=hypothetical protein / transcript_product=hypothetical protein / location=Cvel_scaffold63:151674-155006(-) / protein_length=563 / sequence_SO=supercontig / SO=protein_coding / is_pseudo=false